MEILPSEPEAESSQLLLEEATGTETQKLIMKVTRNRKGNCDSHCILTENKSPCGSSS